MRSVPAAAGRILVTGGAGFIGSHFVDHILEHYPQFKVTVLDALTYAGSVENLPMDKIEFVYGNVCNAALVDELVARCTHIVHFAAETHVTRSIQENRIFFETDVMGTHAVLNAELNHRDQIRRVVHVSTSEVYGTQQGLAAMTENHPLDPMSPYAAAKAGADRMALAYHRTYGLPITIARPFNNYGPRQHVEKLIPRFITAVTMGEKMPVHGAGYAARDFVYVGDTVRAIAALMMAQVEQVQGRAFNIATGAARTVLSIAEEISTRMHGQRIHEIMDLNCADRPGQVLKHTGDYERIERVLGWRPEISWTDGLNATCAWFLQNQDRWVAQIWARGVSIKLPDGARVTQ